MATLVCNTCRTEFSDEKSQKSHYRSDWHQYKLKRKLAGAYGVSKALFILRLQVNGQSSDEWEDINDDDDVLSLDSLELDGVDQRQEVEAGLNDHHNLDPWNATRCFFCDLIPDGSIGGCVEHMHKKHGFFLPDAEYLRDLQGLLSILSLLDSHLIPSAKGFLKKFLSYGLLNLEEFFVLTYSTAMYATFVNIRWLCLSTANLTIVWDFF
ncbi:hypothetical protein L7F22_031726 [Adiantum nelumboides]|nr:hypothetical protein [Adiantum nelumboides]